MSAPMVPPVRAPQVTPCDKCGTARATMHIACSTAGVDYRGNLYVLKGNPAYGSLNAFACDVHGRGIINELETMGCKARVSGVHAE